VKYALEVFDVLDGFEVTKEIIGTTEANSG
jgi:hypothetical protein